MYKTTHKVYKEAIGCLEDSDAQKKDLWLGNAWFAGIDAAVEVSEYGEYIGTVKTNGALYSKDCLETTMKEWLPGSHLVMKTRYKEKTLFAVGYKYNKRKVACFVSTASAAHTEEGAPC